MALVVFLRGINVGGHRRFRPSVLAKELSRYEVVSVGSTGTFVVRKPGSRARFRAELLRKLPFEAEVVFCEGRDLLKLELENPFADESSYPDTTRFVSILAKANRQQPSLPITLPANSEWFVRIMARNKRFVFGIYRRHMRTIGYLSHIDKLFGTTATTRNWNTILALTRVLRGYECVSRTPMVAKFP
ncbi:MAG TPA: DUF1697 domain-containing protein [Terriglobales bacterium]|nr:DUF1697 domain-containing protein [Terriglobales bacterium]